MARAKRTDRAEARRRHRAAFADPLDPELTVDDDESVPTATPSARAQANGAPGARSTTAAAPAATRPSLMGAFRSSFRPVDIRGDIAALPRLLRHWSFFVPVILSGLAVVAFQYFPRESLAEAFFGYFSGVTPFGAVLIAGFFAPRAAWLIGALVSVASGLFLGASLLVQFGGLPDNVFIVTGVDPVTGADRIIDSALAKAQIPQFLTQALTAGTIYGSIFAAAAAWYRRFLNRASPNRSRPTTPTSRRPDGKVPKKPQQRPMLARRR